MNTLHVAHSLLDAVWDKTAHQALQSDQVSESLDPTTPYTCLSPLHSNKHQMSAFRV